MKARFLLALLSATTLIPATAMAQANPEGRGPRGRDRVERVGGEAPEARPEFRGGVRGDVRVQAPEPRPERPRGDGGAWRQGRDDRGGWDRPREADRPDATPRRDPPRDAQGQIDRNQLRRDWQRKQGGADRDRPRGDWQGERRRDDWQRDQQRGDWERNRQRQEWQREQQRREVDRNRGNWNRSDGGWGRSTGDWRDNDRYRDDRNDRQQWNRDWRGDRRYDWNRYRDANRGLYRLPRYYAPQGYGYGYRRFGVGVTLNSFLFGQNYWINDPFSYRLPEAYGPYRWVRYYNDALLVDVRSGRVVDVEYDIFW